MINKKLFIIACILTCISIIGTIFIYSSLPEMIPTHFSFSGEVDRWSSKPMVFITAFLPLVLTVIMMAIPKIDPKKQAYKKHQTAYHFIVLPIIILLIVFHWAAILFSLGYPVSMHKVAPISVGILFIFIGNFMPQIRQNYTLGIRTPWALDNEQNWKATHRVGGYLFILIGILSILSTFLKSSVGFVVFLASIILSSIGVYLYSYYYFKKNC